MNIAHVGSPLARRGGPSGYLWQLEAAMSAFGAGSAHRLTFPPRALSSPPRTMSGLDKIRAALRRSWRALVGPPTLYRPSAAELGRSGGAIDALLTASWQNLQLDARPSVAAALTGDADVLFAHDMAVADRLLAERRRGQQVWLLLHSPMPMALYMAWTWGVPEWDWRELTQLPDTAKWIAWELDVCRRVDRLIAPCQEAVAELARVDQRFGRFTVDTVLTGSAGPARRFGGESRADLRRRFGLPVETPVGLFLGSAQPYRGLHVLLDAVKTLPRSIEGVIAVAGPPVNTVVSHRRVRALGPVSEVSDLLHAVDFIVNVNLFSLFDLSTIEAAEAGRPMLLHAVGGNLRFEQLGVGCVMLPDLATATVAAGLSEMFQASDVDCLRLGERSRASYEAHLTPAHLWANHAALYDRAATSVTAWSA